MSDLKNILSNSEEMNEHDLLKYLEGNATESEMHAIESQMADSAFVNDAVEGLQAFEEKKKILQIKEQLNQQLKKATTKKEKIKKRRGILDQQWLIIAVLAIILLSVVGYLLIHFYSK
jgi:molecular chaperone DnaK (HSP70)